MSILDNLKNDVGTQATQTQLYFALVLLVTTFVILLIEYVLFIRKVQKGYHLTEKPFIYYFTIFTGILFIVFNEIIILGTIIYSDQNYTILGREKAIFIILGYGFFIYGWTNIVLFNLSVKMRLRRILRLIFIAAFSFYIFAVIMTILITFQVVNTHQFIGLGYDLAVAIYVPLLLGDLIALGYVARIKRRMSKFQAWLGFLLFLSLVLQIASIVFNAIPLIIVGNVSHQVHEFWNYIIEPLAYFITAPLTLLFLSWVLFQPKWLEQRFIETDS